VTDRRQENHPRRNARLRRPWPTGLLQRFRCSHLVASEPTDGL